MSEVNVYDLSLMSISLLGILIDGGFGESALKIKPDGPAFGIKKGVDGSVTRYSTGERAGTADIVLGQSSANNDLLSGLLTAALAIPGAGIGTFFVKDGGGTTIIQSTAAWIVGWPEESEWAAESKDRAWKIQYTRARIFMGGNAPIVSPV